MSFLTKLSKNVANMGCLTQRKTTVCMSAKRLCSDVGESENDKTKNGEACNEFRVLRIRPGKERGDTTRAQFQRTRDLPDGDAQYRNDFEWSNVWVGPKTFDPYMVPIPLRQGYVQNAESPGKYGNTELMKIPNFLHLTEPAIKKHCDALRKFCTEWPSELKSKEDMDKHFPITIIASDYCHSSPSIRDPLSRIISLKINIKALEFDAHAKDKFIRLVGDRYNPKTGDLLLIAKNCPLKKQNYDHAMYILTALCFESWKIEDWEKLKTLEDMTEYCFNLRKSRKNLEAYFDYTGKPHPSLENVATILEKYIAENKELHLINSLKNEVIKLLNLPKFER